VIGVAGVVVPLVPVSGNGDWDFPPFCVTAEVAGAAPTRLAVGHGPVLEQPLTAMDRAMRN